MLKKNPLGYFIEFKEKSRREKEVTDFREISRETWRDFPPQILLSN